MAASSSERLEGVVVGLGGLLCRRCEGGGAVIGAVFVAAATAGYKTLWTNSPLCSSSSHSSCTSDTEERPAGEEVSGIDSGRSSGCATSTSCSSMVIVHSLANEYIDSGLLEMMPVLATTTMKDESENKEKRTKNKDFENIDLLLETSEAKSKS
jgi:hypothetical protein